MAEKFRRKIDRVQLNTEDESQENEVLFRITKDEQLFLRELMRYHRSKKTKYLKRWLEKTTNE